MAYASVTTMLTGLKGTFHYGKERARLPIINVQLLQIER